MLQKTLSIVLILLAVISLFLPFQEFRDIWADFDPAGNLINDRSFWDDLFSGRNQNSGLSLILPVLPVVLLIVGNIYSSFFLKTRKLLGIILTGISFVITLYLYLPLGSTAEPNPHSMFRPPVPEIGIGYYLLLIVSILSFLLSFIQLKKVSRK